MQVDATFDGNVSNRRFFKLPHRLYCENTAIVDFVARFFFAGFKFQVSGFKLSAFDFQGRSFTKTLHLWQSTSKSKATIIKRLKAPTINRRPG